MPPLCQHKRDRVEGIFCKKLRATENDRDKPDGIDDRRNQTGNRVQPQVADDERRSQRCQPHGEAAGDSGDCERHRGPHQLVARIPGNLLVNFVRCGTIQLQLRRFGWGILRLFSFFSAV